MNAFKCLVIIISLLFHQVYAEDKLTCDEMKGHVQSVCKKAITGDADAMYDLGLMYDTGEGQPGNKPNIKEAIKWYTKAAGEYEASAGPSKYQNVGT